MANKKKFWEDKYSKDKEGLNKYVTMTMKFRPNEIMAIDKLIEVYGDTRTGIIRRIVRNFLELDDDKQRAALIAEELYQKKAGAILAKQAAEKELERLEADIKRIGCGEKP